MTWGGTVLSRFIWPFIRDPFSAKLFRSLIIDSSAQQFSTHIAGELVGKHGWLHPEGLRRLLDVDGAIPFFAYASN